MDKDDFDLSESNFSMSKRSGQFGMGDKNAPMRNMSINQGRQRDRAGTEK